jgi:hypothetical protein
MVNSFIPIKNNSYSHLFNVPNFLAFESIYWYYHNIFLYQCVICKLKSQALTKKYYEKRKIKSKTHMQLKSIPQSILFYLWFSPAHWTAPSKLVWRSILTSSCLNSLPIAVAGIELWYSLLNIASITTELINDW